MGPDDGRASDGSSFHVSQEGPPPGELTIPAALIPDSDTLLPAWFAHYVSYDERRDDPAGYYTSYRISSRLLWWIEPCEPGTC